MKKGDARRGELLAASEKLFYTKGYENTSVQDILDAVGFSKGGFYHHFDSKHEQWVFFRQDDHAHPFISVWSKSVDIETNW